MSNWRNPQTTFIEYKIVKKSGISGDEMNGFVTKWLGGGRTKMVEIEVKGQMITHDFLAPDRMFLHILKHLYPFEWFGDAMQWVLWELVIFLRGCLHMKVNSQTQIDKWQEKNMHNLIKNKY